MKRIYLRFTNSKSIASTLVEWWTRHWASHVDIVIGYGRYLGSDIKTGVAIIGDEDYLNRIEFYYVEVTEEQYNKFMEIAHAQVGKDYDTWALVGNMFRRNWQETDKWFCSELIAYCFNQCGFMLTYSKTNRVTPVDLIRNPILKPCDVSDIIF
jgi:uncharacterized protein YycO